MVRTSRIKGVSRIFSYYTVKHLTIWASMGRDDGLRHALRARRSGTEL